MTKRWSSIRSNLTSTKREAAKKVRVEERRELTDEQAAIYHGDVDGDGELA